MVDLYNLSRGQAGPDSDIDQYGETGANYNWGYGNVLIVKYPLGSISPTLQDEMMDTLNITASESIFILYAHLEENSLGAGDLVKQGQSLGNVGSTGNSTGQHIHIEVRSGETGSLKTGPFCTRICYANSDDKTPKLSEWLELRHHNPGMLWD